MILYCKHCNQYKEFYPYFKSQCKDCRKAWQRRYNKANPNYLKAKNQNRRAFVRSVPNTLKHPQWTEIQARFSGRCALTDSTDVSIDHVLPLKWGRMGNEVGNVLPLDKTLNLRKGAKNFVEWYVDNEDAFDSKKVDAAIEYLAEANDLTVSEWIDFVYWCEANQRTPEESAAASISSVEEFKALFERT